MNFEQIIDNISRTCTANGTPEVGRELRAVISRNLCNYIHNFSLQEWVDNGRHLRPHLEIPSGAHLT